MTMKPNFHYHWVMDFFVRIIVYGHNKKDNKVHATIPEIVGGGMSFSHFLIISSESPALCITTTPYKRSP